MDSKREAPSDANIPGRSSTLSVLRPKYCSCSGVCEGLHRRKSCGRFPNSSSSRLAGDRICSNTSSEREAKSSSRVLQGEVE